MMPRRATKITTTEVLERKREDAAYLLRNWREWHSEQVMAALAGPHKVAIRHLLDACRAAVFWTDLNAGALLEPFATTDPETTWIARRIVTSFRCAMRETAGLAPFDDEIEF